VNYHQESVKWLQPALLMPQLEEKENSQEAAMLTTNNLAISSMTTYNRGSFMFLSCNAVPDTISIYKYVTDIMQQL
jgi:hypothetical protein